MKLEELRKIEGIEIVKNEKAVPNGTTSVRVAKTLLLAHNHVAERVAKLYKRTVVYETLLSLFKTSCTLSKEDFLKRALSRIKLLLNAEEVYLFDSGKSYSASGKKLSLDEVKKEHQSCSVRELKNKLHLVVVRREKLDEEDDLLCRKFLELVAILSERFWNLKEDVQRLRKRQDDLTRLVEIQKEHIKRMRIIYYVSQAMRSVYDLKNLYRVILLSLVSERGFNFDRAILLKKEDSTNSLVVVSAIGGDSLQEHEELKQYLRRRNLRYTDLVQFLREESLTFSFETNFNEKVNGKRFYFQEHPIFERVVMRKAIVRISKEVLKRIRHEVSDVLDILENNEFVVFPLVGRWDTLGAVIVDNKFTQKTITDLDLDVLKLFSESAGLALENAISYGNLKEKTLALQRQNELVEKLRNFSESILENLETAVITVDKEGRITEWNRKATLLFGFGKESVIGKKLKDLPGFEEIGAIAESVLEENEPLFLNFYKFEDKFFNMRFSPLKDTKTHLLDGVIISIDDVTELYKFEEERKRKERLSILGEMAARVAHEIRNPITIIGGFIKRMRKHIDDPDTLKKYIDIVTNELVRLEGIVKEVLEYSKEEQILEFTEFNLNELVKEVYILFEEKLKEMNIDFCFETDNENLIVQADRSRIKQVLINLVQNAMEATGENGKIRIKSEDMYEKVRVQVWNSGPSIPEELKEKIFSPFFTTKTQGTGLGLPICRKIIEDEHGGKIWVENVENGVLFIFEVPKRPRKGVKE
ncbi:sensor histidine kinase [Thermotoga sp. KOL6]|uniref:sensor histidine kinase n=1 Tax=Thermotoga sp. KOL6 TaxID=126741 RepID=UPI000C7671E8|nr:sensor histidine kinase [Thermotoga sp. KOL6]PLV60011.1 histidine kinase [Thermotoga sp. KOL6]